MKQIKTHPQKLTIQSMNMISTFFFFVHSSFIEVKRRTAQFLLALGSVLIVVAASAVSQTIIDNAPIIFLNNAQSSAGQIDVSIQQNCGLPPPLNSPENYIAQFSIRTSCYSSLNMLNANAVQKILNQPQTSRVVQSAQISSESMCTSKGCAGSSLKVMFWDTNQEKNIGIGSTYPFEAMKYGQCALSKNNAELIKVKIGDQVLIKTNFFDQLSLVYESLYFKGSSYNKFEGENFQNNLVNISKLSETMSKCQLTYILDESYGKMGDGEIDNYFYMELAYINQYISKSVGIVNVQLNNGQSVDISEQISTLDPKTYVDEILINLPNRISYYLNSNYEKIQENVSMFASQISQKLGVFSINMDLPVLKQLQSTQYSALFLGIILNMIIAILFVLSSVLLYSLLLISVETKTYELGVIRVLGFNKPGIAVMIISQALSYVIPAIILGLIVSIPILMQVSKLLKASIGVNIGIIPTPNAIGLSIGIGLMIPLLSSIQPIRSALSQNLGFALDINRSKSQAVQITIESGDGAFPWGRIQFAIVSSAYGISIYYLLPIALLSFNLSLLLVIFFMILLGMLAGLVILSFNLQYLVERFVVYLFFCWEKAHIRLLIIKNLASHRIKNRRTALMYSISIAFVVFIFTGMTVQIQGSAYLQLQKQGAKMVIYVPEDTEIGQENMILIEQMLLNGILKNSLNDYAYRTQFLQSFLQQTQKINSVYLTNVGKLYQRTPRVIGVSPQYLNVAIPGYLIVSEVDKQTGLDIIQELYTARGSQSMILGEAFSDYFHSGTNFNQSLVLALYNGPNSIFNQFRTSSILQLGPGMTFSKIPSVTTQTIVVSLETYMRFSGQSIKYGFQLPVTRILLNIIAGQEEKVFLAFNQLKTNYSMPYNIWDYRSFQAGVTRNQNLIQIIFMVLLIIALILCFFSLSGSVTSNLFEQTKEISVLRALGLTKIRMILIYIYEAFAILMSSCLIGLIIGWIVGYTMALQQTLFTGMPLFFVFPWSLLLVIILVSIFCSILSTIIPSLTIMKQEIAQIMKLR